MLTVWGRKTSSNVQALMWAIGELGLPYERLDVGHKYGGLDNDAFYALNPNRTIPVLRDGDDPPLWETGAILRYLASRYGAGPFWPSDLSSRSQVDKWAEWSKINVAIAFTGPVFWQLVRTPPQKRDPQVIRLGIQALENKLAIAEEQLQQHPFLVGDDLTLADIQFGHILFRYYDLDIERRALPHLATYYADLSQRPAYREHVMIAYDELRA